MPIRYPLPKVTISTTLSNIPPTKPPNAPGTSSATTAVACPPSSEHQWQNHHNAFLEGGAVQSGAAVVNDCVLVDGGQQRLTAALQSVLTIARFPWDSVKFVEKLGESQFGEV